MEQGGLVRRGGGNKVIPPQRDFDSRNGLSKVPDPRGAEEYRNCDRDH